MTPKERRNPKLIDGKRRRRIAAGSGTKVEDINKLIKMHRQMADMMKTMGRNPGMMQKMAQGVDLSADGQAVSLRDTDDEVFRAAEELGINISSRFETSSIDDI